MVYENISNIYYEYPIKCLLLLLMIKPLYNEMKDVIFTVKKIGYSEINKFTVTELNRAMANIVLENIKNKESLKNGK